jgi:hypothetical protein
MLIEAGTMEVSPSASFCKMISIENVAVYLRQEIIVSARRHMLFLVDRDGAD